jgi:putative two-component system response regulator
MITEDHCRAASILIVDDQPANVLLLEKVLHAAGYHALRSTTDSREVARLYQESPPDLVLLDLSMPHLDGFAVLEQIKKFEHGSYAPVLILTAQADRTSRLRALQAGARDFLTKPFDQVEVLTRISNLLEVRLLHNEVRKHNLGLEEKIRERTKELHETQLEIVRRLGRAAEYRDDDTGFHIIRMSRSAAMLGEAAGLDQKECELLLHATPMHDIGKIGIPDHILLKPAKLTAEEWELMRMHPTIGGDLLSGSSSPLLQMAEAVARTHHERWDGTGYPDGLKGEEIPLAGRICSICDVFDALTSDRPYKKAWGVEAALAEIDRLSGIQFDPRLVQCFRRIVPAILSIRSQYPDSAAAVTELEEAGTERWR